MGNYILVTLLATHPIVSQVITKEQCMAAQAEASAKHCVAVCIDVNRILTAKQESK